MSRTQMVCFNFRPYRFSHIRPDGNRVDGKVDSKTVPKARSGHRLCIDELGHLYSFGGYNPHVTEVDEDLGNDPDWQATKPLFRELWKFDVITKTWNRLKTGGEAPSQLASHCAVIVGRVMVVYGGTGVPFGQSSSNLIYTCHLDTLLWQRVNVSEDSDPASLPIEQYGQAIAMDMDEGCLYVVGGTTGYRYSIDVHKFCFRTHRWHLLFKKTDFPETFPEERYRHEIVVYKKKLYVFGGGTADSCFKFDDVPVFDLTKNSWSRFETKPDPSLRKPASQQQQQQFNQTGYPTARRCHGCVQHGNQVYIVGGIDGLQICEDIWRFDLDIGQWTKLKEKMPLPVYFHGTAMSRSGQMFVFGGVNSAPHNQRNNDLYSIWLDKPLLKDLAWTSLMAYSDLDTLKKTNADELLKLGVPLNYVRRIRGAMALRPALPS